MLPATPMSVGDRYYIHITILQYQAEGFSGADLSALLREAGLDVLRQLKSRETLAGKGVYTEQGKEGNI